MFILENKTKKKERGVIHISPSLRRSSPLESPRLARSFSGCLSVVVRHADVQEDSKD